ncbi:hypothetical protein E2C01_054129 [Portunus trituberculatus]|uniref:Uncharacterized protein n=1 Tax=Portunus trituberculatus TaxID=210409 RepID=A0A5B7GM90_PORTR|nr:hypothetical protein [Portunus trituberculatus]
MTDVLYSCAHACRNVGVTPSIDVTVSSRLRIIGHNLTIETGHWNRRGRGRMEVVERLCPYGAVQTELQVLESCPLTQAIRTRYDFSSWNKILNNDTQFPVAKIVYNVFSCFD